MLRQRTIASFSLLLSLVLVSLAGTAAPGQGLLVSEIENRRVRLPRPWVRAPQPAAGSYKIESIDVDAKLTDQVARVQVAQKFRNTGSQQMEVSFLFPLPYDGAIDQLTLLVDGKEFDAKLLPADEARATYESIVRRNEDPALLEWVGNGMFRTSVFPVPAGAERTVTLRYTQLCRRSGSNKGSQSLTDFLFPLKAAKYTSEPLDRLKVRLAIESSTPLSSVYSPSHQIKVERPDARRAIVTHEETKVLPTDDFRLFLETGKQDVSASLVTYRPDKNQPGYFLLLASPKLEAAGGEPPAKTVLFVVDRSGSMSGDKIEQAKGAMRFVLNNLREGDTFNIVAYDSDVESFRPELEKLTDKSRKAALAYVDGLYAGGSTNIDGALQRALGMLEDSSRPNYVMFLTDGLPTAGETGEAAIVENTKSVNAVRARVFPFGVGYDVNSRLLEKIAHANYGQSEYVRPNENIEAAVSRLYNRIGTPVMTDVRLAIDVEGGSSDGISRVYPTGTFDLFAGDQVVLVGRYARAGSAKVTLSGAVAGKEQSFDFPAELTTHSPDDTDAFIGRLWATRRVGEIVDEIDLKGKNEELIKELVELATRHGVVTQYTSFLADENADHNATVDNRRMADTESDALAATSGRGAFGQRASNQALQNAPSPAATRSFGLGGMAPEEQESQARKRARGNAWYYSAEDDRSHVADNIRQIGRKTFFLRSAGNEQRWCDSTVNETEEKNAKPIKRFSREYFDLIAQHGRHVAQYLAVDDPVVIKLGGEVYTW